MLDNVFQGCIFHDYMQCHWSIVIFIENIHSNACKTGVEGVEGVKGGGGWGGVTLSV